MTFLTLSGGNQVCQRMSKYVKGTIGFVKECQTLSKGCEVSDGRLNVTELLSD